MDLLPREAEARVRKMGFSNVFTWRDGPNAYYEAHSHTGLTTHLILSGTLTILFPDDERPTKQTFGAGQLVDVEAGRKHEVWIGADGCESVIGE